MGNCSFCVFVDNMYYYDFVALYNSWKYYEHKTPLKVYSHNVLSEERFNKISEICEIIKVNKPDTVDVGPYYGKQTFKYYAMLKSMDEYQILLDADTIFLSNTDHLFDIIKAGNITGSTEFDVKFNNGQYYKNNEDYFYDKNILQQHLNADAVENFTIDLKFDVFNGGFLGFSKEKHSYLLKKTIDILWDSSIARTNAIFANEQFMVNCLIKLLKLPTHSLPRQNWMNTWSCHKSPKKIIKIENEKFAVYDENGQHIKFYHFTGDIGMPTGLDKTLYSCRPHQLYENQSYEVKFTRKDVEKLWYNKHQNPVLLLYEYFANKGLGG